MNRSNATLLVLIDTRQMVKQVNGPREVLLHGPTSTTQSHDHVTVYSFFAFPASSFVIPLLPSSIVDRLSFAVHLPNFVPPSFTFIHGGHTLTRLDTEQNSQLGFSSNLSVTADGHFAQHVAQIARWCEKVLFLRS